MYTAQQSFNKVVKKFNEGGERHKGWFNPFNDKDHCAISSLFYGTHLWREHRDRALYCDHGKDRFTWLGINTGLDPRLIQTIIALWDQSKGVSQDTINYALKEHGKEYGLVFNEPVQYILSQQVPKISNVKVTETKEVKQKEETVE